MAPRTSRTIDWRIKGSNQDYIYIAACDVAKTAILKLRGGFNCGKSIEQPAFSMLPHRAGHMTAVSKNRGNRKPLTHSGKRTRVPLPPLPLVLPPFSEKRKARAS